MTLPVSPTQPLCTTVADELHRVFVWSADTIWSVDCANRRANALYSHSTLTSTSLILYHAGQIFVFGDGLQCVDAVTGASRTISSDPSFRSVVCGVIGDPLVGHAHVVMNTLRRVHLQSGVHQGVSSDCWAKATAIVQHGPYLYVFAHQLYAVHPSSGRWARIDPREWSGVSSATVWNNLLVTVSGDDIWIVKPIAYEREWPGQRNISASAVHQGPGTAVSAGSMVSL